MLGIEEENRQTIYPISKVQMTYICVKYIKQKIKKKGADDKRLEGNNDGVRDNK